MALRTILTDGDPALHKACRPVTNFDQRLHDLLDDLKETLANANGAGLAAPDPPPRRCGGGRGGPHAGAGQPGDHLPGGGAGGL